jgi:glucokinase
MSAGYLLAADVGGTKTLAALAARGVSRPAIIARRTYANRDFDAMEPLIEQFLALPETAPHARAIAGACFSVAGPVSGNSTTLTNLGWRIEADALAARLALRRLTLVNDFAAAGLGIPCLAHEDLATLQAGQVRMHGVRAVVGAGTGLGAGWLTWDGERYQAHASEAGHAAFAPADELQDRLLAHLRRIFGRVSWERVVSGPGLMRIFSFLQETGVGLPSREIMAAAKARTDTTEVIGEFGLARRDPLAVRALDLFVAAYGAFAGDMALTTLAHGGMFVAGGIAPRILPRLREPSFMRAFLNKGRYRELLETIPVHVVLNPQVSLLGALLEAERLTAGA